MIVIRRDGMYACPLVLCDACGRWITGKGNVYWIEPKGVGDIAKVWFVHKPGCTGLDRVIEQHTGEHVHDEDLDTWLDHLRRNTALKDTHD
ncbi:hypothetical protein [Micromonospora zamorensis]|uniref:hypothetical protein n=1 Tax=Micromonospora zamorensis TaxID=709883 RepID=UPI0008201465|nr:hypothetical protein [Micromonospora zamorensis]SCG38159.1 hypothetical protein GA0070619_0610 [Micromonospora zamorensis]